MKNTGIRVPIACTTTVFEEYIKIPEGVTGQDFTGCAWDLPWMFRCAIKRSPADTSEIRFALHVRNDNRDRTPPQVRLKAVIGPGDRGEPVLTIMLPDEDWHGPDTYHEGRPIFCTAKHYRGAILILCSVGHLVHRIRTDEWAGSIWECRATDPTFTVRCLGPLCQYE